MADIRYILKAFQGTLEKTACQAEELASRAGDAEEGVKKLSDEREKTHRAAKENLDATLAGEEKVIGATGEGHTVLMKSLNTLEAKADASQSTCVESAQSVRTTLEATHTSSMQRLDDVQVQMGRYIDSVTLAWEQMAQDIEDQVTAVGGVTDGSEVIRQQLSEASASGGSLSMVQAGQAEAERWNRAWKANAAGCRDMVSGAFESALTRFRLACAEQVDWRILLNLAIGQYALGDFPACVATLREATTAGLPEELAWTLETLSSLGESDLRISCQVPQDAPASCPEDLAVYLTIATAHLVGGACTRALQYLHAARRSPQSATVAWGVLESVLKCIPQASCCSGEAKESDNDV